MACCGEWDLTDDGSEINGECPDCGMPTVDGSAYKGCNYSPCDCDTCGARPCDLSC